MDLDSIARAFASQILEAIEDGKADDNLPGKGKPIVFDDDLNIPLHVRIANKVLKNAGVVPEWVQFRRDILDERKAVENTLARLERENNRRRDKVLSFALESNHPHMQAYAQWHRKSRELYLSMLKSVNTSILKFCMSAPSSASEAGAFAPYRIELEMSRFDEAVTPIRDLPKPPPENARSEGLLRSAARSRYEARDGAKNAK